MQSFPILTPQDTQFSFIRKYTNRDNNLCFEIFDTLNKLYFHYTEEGSRLFELAIGELALKFVAVSTMPEIKMIKSYINTYADKWVYHYLSDNGIDLNKYLTYFNSGVLKDGNIFCMARIKSHRNGVSLWRGAFY